MCFIRIFLILFVSLCTLTSKALDDIYISKGTKQLIPIAINNFASGQPVYDKRVVENVLGVIADDLNHCGYFHTISPVAFIETSVGINHRPHFASWRQINANLLLNGEIVRHGSKTFTLKVRLWDTVSEKAVFSESFTAPVQLWRKLSHKIADKIYESLTGDRGYFDTRIFYVSEAYKGKKILKRLAVMDYDGSNHQFLTNDKTIVLTPRLSPNGKHLLYVSYEKKTPKIFVMDLSTGRSTVLGNFAAMSFAPKFSPDGSKIVFSMTKKGATDIFELNLRTKNIKQMTSGLAINTSPSYSPDGAKIYFNSDRGGAPQLYVMDSDGGNVQRISFGEGSYYAPACSPNGKHVVFMKSLKGQGFFIGVMRSDGSQESLIASGYLVESPTWAPNSRVIAFAKTAYAQKGELPTAKIYTVDVSGHNERLVPTPHNATDPEWSWHYE